MVRHYTLFVTLTFIMHQYDKWVRLIKVESFAKQHELISFNIMSNNDLDFVGLCQYVNMIKNINIMYQIFYTLIF